MTSFIAACGSGRSTSFIPAVPAAWSVTTIAFMIIFSSVICLFAGYVPAIKSPFVALGGADRTQPADLESAGRPRASMGACRSRTNADDRLPVDPLGRIEGGDGVVEGRDVADVRPQSSVPHPLDDLTQLGTIGHDNEVDRQAVGGPCLGRPGDGHQRSSGSNQGRGPLRDVAAEDIENQIDSADVFQGVVLEVDELIRAEVERRLTARRASGADDVR